MLTQRPSPCFGILPSFHCKATAAEQERTSRVRLGAKGMRGSSASADARRKAVRPACGCVHTLTDDCAESTPLSGGASAHPPARRSGSAADTAAAHPQARLDQHRSDRATRASRIRTCGGTERPQTGTQPDQRPLTAQASPSGLRPEPLGRACGGASGAADPCQVLQWILPRR